MIPARKAFTDALLSLAACDQRIFALATDSRGSVTLSEFAQRFPGQFVECGIAEQDAVGIAAGLANAGLIPFVCSPACFFMRAAEQVKVDIGYSCMNVKLIGVSGGVSYGALGATHHSTQDIALMRTIPNLTVILPADAAQAAAAARALAKASGPAYVRMGRGEVPDVYGGDAPFEIGRANVLRRGSTAAIIACGEMLYPALKAGEAADATVIDMHTVRPLDREAVLFAAAHGAVITVEEHCVNGGLGGAVAEILAQAAPVRMRIMGLPNESLYSGTQDEVREHYGLTREGILGAVRELAE